jgi:hypothetical protein
MTVNEMITLEAAPIQAIYLYLQAHRMHVNLGFYHATGLPDPDNLLEGTGKSLRHTKIRHLEATRHPAVLDIMRQAIAERRRFILCGRNSMFVQKTRRENTHV